MAVMREHVLKSGISSGRRWITSRKAARAVASNGANWLIRKWTSSHTQKEHLEKGALFVVGGGGFEPPKSETSDLQSDAFGHSAIRPKYLI